MWKYVVAFILISFSALAQETSPSATDLSNSYIKALEAQIAFRIQQASFFEAQLKNWIDYAKPLYEQPKPAAEAK